MTDKGPRVILDKELNGDYSHDFRLYNIFLENWKKEIQQKMCDAPEYNPNLKVLNDKVDFVYSEINWLVNEILNRQKDRLLLDQKDWEILLLKDKKTGTTFQPPFFSNPDKRINDEQRLKFLRDLSFSNTEIVVVKRLADNATFIADEYVSIGYEPNCKIEYFFIVDRLEAMYVVTSDKKHSPFPLEAINKS